MQIKVDRAACSGHARCLEMAPEFYELDDEGFSIADGTDVPAGAEAAAELGADACPERAITLIR